MKHCEVCGETLNEWCTINYCERCCINKKCPTNTRCEFIKQMTKVLRTSVEWSKICLYGAEITEPDGWDEKKFHYSWFEEKINQMEFLKRTRNSTVIYVNDLLDFLKKVDNFLDEYKI